MACCAGNVIDAEPPPVDPENGTSRRRKATGKLVSPDPQAIRQDKADWPARRVALPLLASLAVASLP